MSVTASPAPDTWLTGQLITADWLNANIRDVQKFLAYAPLTILTRNAAQTVNNATATPVQWDTEVIDLDGMVTVPSTSLTARRPGLYAIQFENYMSMNTGGDQRSQTILINGVGTAQQVDYRTATYAHSGCVQCLAALNTDDVISCNVYQDSGVALTIGNAVGTYNAPRLSVRVVSTADLDIDYGTGTTTNPTPPPSKPPTPHVPTSYTKKYYATWSRTYDGDNGTTWDDSASAYQGYYDGNRGNTKSLIGFNFGQIWRDLSGASNIRVQATFKVAHTYWGSGSTIVLGSQNWGSKPATWSGSHVRTNLKQKGSCKAGGTYTIDFGKNTANSNQFKTWATGICFGPGPSTNRIYYAYLYGGTQGGKPYLTISYTK